MLYALDSKMLPLVVDTIEVAERVRTKLMGIHKRLSGGPAHVSPRFSGKDAEGKPLEGHKHAFILPLDENRDGRLDHIVVVCREPLDSVERLALDRLESVWQPDGKPDLRCIPVLWGRVEDLAPPVQRVESVTPFVPVRHYRKGRGSLGEWLAGELARECKNHDLPPPVRIQAIERTRLKIGHEFRWLEFRRNRKGDPSRLGYGFEMEFEEPVKKPVALGYGCHFGLGQFRAVRE